MNAWHDPLAENVRFGKRRVVPHVCVIDRKPHLRTFLRESLSDLGFVAHECADPARALAVHAWHPIDLVVVAVPTDVDDASEALRELAAEPFEGRVLLIGGRSCKAVEAAQRLGNQLGLSMLPLLGAPFRSEELANRVRHLRTDELPQAVVNVEAALANNWLELWYQPKFESRDLRPSGAEALCRLRHPVWGVVLPSGFIPPENDPKMRRLSEFVLARAWSDRLFLAERRPVELAVNLPLAVLQERSFRDFLRRASPCNPDLGDLMVEIDGAEVVQDLVLVQAIADHLRPYDIRLSIDDVGPEWPLLTRWSDAPVAEIKVDRQFVQGCGKDPRKREACRGIIDLARRLGARTVAEGVETRADLIAVRALGFDLVQGFLLEKPMDIRKFARFHALGEAECRGAAESPPVI